MFARSRPCSQSPLAAAPLWRTYVTLYTLAPWSGMASPTRRARGACRGCLTATRKRQAPTLLDVPRRWVALNIDGMPALAGTDLHNLIDCGGAARATLPPSFAHVACLARSRPARCQPLEPPLLQGRGRAAPAEAAQAGARPSASPATASCGSAWRATARPRRQPCGSCDGPRWRRTLQGRPGTGAHSWVVFTASCDIVRMIAGMHRPRFRGRPGPPALLEHSHEQDLVHHWHVVRLRAADGRKPAGARRPRGRDPAQGRGSR